MQGVRNPWMNPWARIVRPLQGTAGIEATFRTDASAALSVWFLRLGAAASRAGSAATRLPCTTARRESYGTESRLRSLSQSAKRNAGAVAGAGLLRSRIHTMRSQVRKVEASPESAHTSTPGGSSVSKLKFRDGTLKRKHGYVRSLVLGLFIRFHPPESSGSADRRTTQRPAGESHSLTDGSGQSLLYNTETGQRDVQVLETFLQVSDPLGEAATAFGRFSLVKCR